MTGLQTSALGLPPRSVATIWTSATRRPGLAGYLSSYLLLLSSWSFLITYKARCFSFRYFIFRRILYQWNSRLFLKSVRELFAFKSGDLEDPDGRRTINMDNVDSALMDPQQHIGSFDASKKHSGGYAVITGATTPPLPASQESRMEGKSRRQIKLMEKIGLWNFTTNLVGSLIVLGILIFLWFLVSTTGDDSPGKNSISPSFYVSSVELSVLIHPAVDEQRG